MKFSSQRNIWLSCVLLISMSTLAAQSRIYVKPGAKNGSGSKSKPYGTIQEARTAAVKASKKKDGDVEVLLRGGVYTIDKPIEFSEKHSGVNGKIIFKAYEGEKAVISGGVKVEGWQHVEGPIYKARLDRDTKLRSLYVNGKRKRMAGTDMPVAGLGDWGRFEIDGSEEWSFGAGSGIEGIKFSSADIDVYKNPQDVELVQFNIWTEKILCAKDIVEHDDTTIIKFQQPYGAIATSMAWAGKINYKKLFVIRNAFELLDSPGEFYFDRTTKTLYYYSEGEDMTQVEVYASTSMGLIKLTGSSTSSRVSNLRFEGITFSHDDWQLMEVAGSHGFAGIQSLGLAVKFIPDGNWHPTKYNSTDIPTGTIQVTNASNISFVRNYFERNGSAISINLANDVVDTEVSGNSFQNLLGNAVNIGHPQHYEVGDGELFKPGVEGVCKNVLVSNNYLRNVCLDYRQVEGITSFFVENVTITHNDIAGTPYGAITCGWWWGNSGLPPSTVARGNLISYNKAGNSHQVLDDGGIIYVLGEQPDSYIEHNYVFNGPRCIYPDDGSAYWTIRDNVVGNPSYKHMWLHLWTKRCHDIIAYRNYVKNHFYMDNGTNDIVEQTYSFREDDFSTNPDAQQIIDEAGIEEAFQDMVPDSEPEVISIFPKGFKESDRFH
ncbi:right-handed parallel beta-helix repeat-containing protein [Marinoscillum sp. MHG1-6]|uniref:right-handed parallel beta-helix repeat-containing protein n=1 Tax=Marinoscillum sp. MHG1-6 TaxID=2959627 RepID=UPI00215749E4|nr:right-handed parallel beta-helix repeat-containing protein [Marinoscillum sp. MHG1-6]